MPVRVAEGDPADEEAERHLAEAERGQVDLAIGSSGVSEAMYASVFAKTACP